MRKHLEFQIVTPRTLDDFQGQTLILPDVRVLDDTEKTWLQKYVGGGKTLIITGEDATGILAAENVVRFRKCPGAEYSAALKTNFESANPDQERAFIERLKVVDGIRVVASSLVATSIAGIDGKPYVFFANFAGLREKANPIQTPQVGIRVVLTGMRKGHGFFLPFLGTVRPVEETPGAHDATYNLPPIEKGAVFWWEPSQSNSE